MSTPEKTVIYCRISLDQAGEALGVERQERECREFCAARGWPVDELHVDNDISATTGKARPGFEAVLASGATRIVVWHTDRLVRLTRDLERVIELGVDVHAVTAGHLDLSTAAGRAVARTVTAWATYEGEQKAARQRAQQRQRVDAGRPWWTHRPFGYQREGDVVTLDEKEADAIREAYAALLRGESYTSIMRRWQGDGMLTTAGGEWTRQSVRQVLHSPRNAGILVSKGVEVGTAEWPAIVDVGQWHAALDRATNRNMSGRGQGKRKALLSGIATCGRCGARVNQGVRSRGGRIYRTVCHHTTIKADWLDEYVRKATLRELSSPAAALAWGRTKEDTEGLAAREEAAGLRTRLDDLSLAYAEGEITRQQLAKASSSLREKLTRAEALAERSYHPSPLGDQTTIAGVIKAWGSLDQLAQRAIIISLWEGIAIQPRQRGTKPDDGAVRMVLRR